MNLSDQELVVLEIMSRGEDVLAVGNWEKVIERLADCGLARKLDGWNQVYRITDEGMAAFEGGGGVVDLLVEEHNAKVGPVIDGEFEEVV